MEFFGLLLETIFPTFTILFGLIGNIIVLIVFSDKRFKNSASKNYLQILAINDGLAVLTLLPYSGTMFAKKLLYVNEFNCKTYTFIAYYITANSSWLLAFINLERLFQIKYSQIKIFKRVRFQIFLVIIIITWNLVFYLIHIPYINLFTKSNDKMNQTVNETQIICDVEDESNQDTIAWFDLVNYTLAPFLLMIISSILIIRSIYGTRKRLMVKKNFITKNHMRRIKRDFQFSIVILTLNFAFFVFNFPISVYSFFGYAGDFEYDLLNVFCYIQYTINILVYIFLNKKFKEVFKLKLLNMFYKSTRKKSKDYELAYQT